MAPVLAALLVLVGTHLGASPSPRSAAGLEQAAAPAAGAPRPVYAWPVRGPVIRPFEAPAGPFGPGHRGIDIGTPVGSLVRAAQEGTVAFAGRVAGAHYVSIDHPDGVRTTYSWLRTLDVERGRAVARGEAIGRSGLGHPRSEVPHLHFGARLGPRYLDPMLLLEPGSLAGLVRLAPLEG